MQEPYLKKNVKLSDFDENWAKEFKIEKLIWENILGEHCLQIYHIGSTSIGIKAKPIVDILIVIDNFENLSKCLHILESMEYEIKGENGIVGRRYFQKDFNGERKFHIHMFESGNEKILDHLAFRDFLIENKNYAKEYESLKVKLAEMHKNDKYQYQLGKNEFIENLIKKARKRAN